MKKKFPPDSPKSSPSTGTTNGFSDGLNEKERDLKEVKLHYDQWNQDNARRMSRKNGWNDVTDAYWGKLPNDWPYLNRVVDPRIRTSLIEKNARLLNAKLRGHLVPREGADVIGSRINNAILDFQWDNANFGGTMLEKWGAMDLDTRLYSSKFALIYWRHQEDEKGEVLFDGNDMKPLDLRDCGMDMSADHVRNAKWFQSREWVKIEDLDTVSNDGITPKWPGIKELKTAMSQRQDRRDTEYQNRILSLKGLSDRVGDDKAFPVVELVTEYQTNKWITFAPKYDILMRSIPNPYEHKKIPIIQLRYYMIQGDPLGESEVEPVLPIWKAIQATVCGYLDNMANHIRPPLKIIEGAARIETIVYGPDAQWLVDRQDAVMEMPSNGEAMKNFQTTYQALVSAFNTAMGDTSLGVSAVDVSSRRRTATEIKNSEKQQNNRDQKNQLSLSEAIEDMMSMWLVNNRQFMFADRDKQQYILRIIGQDLFNYFQRAGLDEMILPAESMKMIGDVITQHQGNIPDNELNGMIEAGKVPKFPIFDNPSEKDPSKLSYKPKMSVNEMKDGAEVTVVPEDLNGSYDYVASVRSMAAGADQEMIEGRQNLLETLTTNPAVLQLLAQEGVRPLMKDLLVNSFEDMGVKDAERYFEKLPPPPPAPVPGQIPPDPNSQMQGLNQFAGMPGNPQQLMPTGQTGGPPSPQPQGQSSQPVANQPPIQ